MKAFKFSKEGLEQANSYTGYKELVLDTTVDILDEHPELFPAVIGLAVIGLAIIVAPAASMVAYKSGAAILGGL